MKRTIHFFFLSVLLLIFVTPALAQDKPKSTTAEANPPLEEPVTLPPYETDLPYIPSTSWQWAAEYQRLMAAEKLGIEPDARVRNDIFGDWTNTEAFSCWIPLGLANNAAFMAGLAAVPPFDVAPAQAEFAANLALKFCGPVVAPPLDAPAYEDGQCGYTFTQHTTEGTYQNYLGIPLPWGDVFPGRSWGDFGQPAVGHWNTDVELQLRIPAPRTGENEYRLPTGLHYLTYRGDTQISLLDAVPRYIPGWAWTRLNKLLKLEGFAEEAAETTLEVVLDLWGGTWNWVPSWSTSYNIETQQISVLDTEKPDLPPLNPVGVEAIEPGGISKETLLSLLRRGMNPTDNCDPAPDLIALNENILPDFVTVGSSENLIWQAVDNGPYDKYGSRNYSLQRGQVFTVQDTLAPIIVPPPDIVQESTELPVLLDLGNPGTFDLADLDPTVKSNACSRPGVQCNDDETEMRFPAGKTTVTWTAVDASGNSSSTEQYVNIKPIGSNRPPTASGNSADAVSYEQVKIILQANDPDNDRLWFEIEDQPQNGFFHSQLYPYFIDDYRLFNQQEIDFKEYCSIAENQGTYIPVSWPHKANFMDVADDGTIYVHDNGIARCGSHDNSVSMGYRVAIFRPDGTYDEVSSSNDVKDMEVDWRNELIITSQHDIGGSYSVVRVFDLDINQIVSYRVDDVFRQPKHVIIDFEQNIMYATDGFLDIGSATLAVMKMEEPPPGHDPRTTLDVEELAKYTVPGKRAWQELELDSQGNLYASERDDDRVYKWTRATLDENGNFTPGELVGWMGRCDSGPGCDSANGRSFGYSCTDDTCSVSETGGERPGQFDFPRAMAVDPNDILYVTDFYNQRVQRFTPEGYFAGQAVSECDGSCFVLGDMGRPSQVTVNSHHFYVLNTGIDLLHIFKTTPISRLTDGSAEVIYQSNNNFVGTDTFTYFTTDGLNESAPAAVSVNVARNYRPPVAAGPISVTTEEDEYIELPFDGYDPDGDLDTLTFVTVDEPEYGSVRRSGDTYIYRPDPNFEGVDNFTYAASDGTLTSEPQAVEVSVIGVNDAPSFPEGNTPASVAGFALRVSGNAFDPSRFAKLGTADDPLKIGRGFNTVFSITFEDPDDQDINTVSIDWGDGSGIEWEGKLLDDGTTTGPILGEGVTGGAGSVSAEHAFANSGSYNVEFCIFDNVYQDDDGNKSLTGSSTKSCTSMPVEVSPMVDLVVDIQPSANPYAVGAPLSYDLIVANNAPLTGSGLTATGINVTSTLDSRITAASATVDGGSCRIDGHIVRCSLSNLPAGQERVIQIKTQIPSTIEAGSQIAGHVEFDVDQPNQADVPENGSFISVVHAGDFIVNTPADEADTNPGNGVCETGSGKCSLRAAIEEANQQPGMNSISLAGWPFLIDEQLVITDDLHITGLGARETSISPTTESRIFNVAAGARLTLEKVTLQGGTSTANGGAIYNEGHTRLTESQISGSHADGAGGAVWNSGELFFRDTSITGNSSSSGAGGIANLGTLTFKNVTLSGNEGQSGGLSGSGQAEIVQSTITNNHGQGSGGGINSGAGSISLRSTLLAGNTADGSGPNCTGTVSSEGYNLIGKTNGCNISQKKGSDQLDKDPRLEGLSLNGGQTMAHMPAGGSPAIDKGACDTGTDQYGVPRPIDGDLDGQKACDIGATEFQPRQLHLPMIIRN